MTFLPMALTVSRAMTLLPMAAWMATSNIWRGDKFLHLRRQQAAFGGRSIGVQNERKGVDRLARDEHVELDELAHLIAGQVIIERCITARRRLFNRS